MRRRAHFALLRTLGLTRARLARAARRRRRADRASPGAAWVSPAATRSPMRVARIRRRPRRGLLSRRGARCVLRSAGRTRVRRSGIAVAALGSLAAGARGGARETRGRAEGRRRAAGVRPPAHACAGLGMLAAGAAIDALPPVAGLPIFGYLAIALLLVGTLLLLPRIAAFALARRAAHGVRAGRARARPAARRAGTGRREPRDHRRQRVAHGVDGDHGRVVPAVARRLALRVLPADLYLRAGHRRRQRVPPPDEQAALAAMPGVARIAFLRVQNVCSIPRSRASRCSRATCRSTTRAAALPLVGDRYAPRAGDPPPVMGERGAGRLLWACSRARASTCRSARRRATFVVAGVWRDYARQQGALVIDRVDVRALTGDDDRHRRRHLARAGHERRPSCATRIDARAARRQRSLDARHAGRDPRDLAAHLRPHVRRDLRAARGRGRSSASPACRRRSARWCSRGGASSACCGTSA